MPVDAFVVIDPSGIVQSVDGRKGAVTLTSSDVGLGNVLNTRQVTSVTIATPSAFYNFPINFNVDANGNASGVLALANQASNTVFAGPNGGTAAPTMRALVANDIPGTLNTTTFSGPATFSSSGIFNKTLVETPISLPFASTVNTDASSGNVFKFTATSNFTLGNPTNGIDGQKVIWRIKQDATGGRTIAFGTNFGFGIDIGSGVILSPSGNNYDYLGAIYNSDVSKWHVVSLVRGYQ